MLLLFISASETGFTQHPGRRGRGFDMRMMVGRPQLAKDGFEFNLDGARPSGPQTVIRAARDPIGRIPTDERITALLQRTLCRAKLSEDSTAWEIEVVTGEKETAPLGATFDFWQGVCESLLRKALTHDS
jgi:hypothetical protein